MSSEVLGKSKARHGLSTAQGAYAPDPRAVQGSQAVQRLSRIICHFLTQRILHQCSIHCSYCSPRETESSLPCIFHETAITLMRTALPNKSLIFLNNNIICRVDVIISQMRKLTLRKVIELSHGHKNHRGRPTSSRQH